MSLTVRERADTIGTLRFVSVFTMELLARWVPTTVDLEVKILFGRHIWEFAQHADLLGKRTHELRTALNYSPKPRAQYAEALELAATTSASRDRVEVMYDVLVPDLATRYRAFLAATDPFLDEPSVRIVERNLADLPRLVAESNATRAERNDITSANDGIVDRVRAALGGAVEYVQFRPAAATVEETLK